MTHKTPEMVERVARAIWERRRKFAAQEAPSLPPLEEWGDGSIPAANGVIDEARAAIEAMRIPTEEMLNAFGCDLVEQWASAIYTALGRTP